MLKTDPHPLPEPSVNGLRGAVAGWAGFFAAVLAAWAALWAMAQERAALAGLWGAELLAGLCAADAGAAPFAVLWAMWALMAGAMMAPTAVPAFATWVRLPAGGSGGLAGTLSLGAGYLAVWTIAAAGFAGVQAALAGLSLVAPDAASRSPVLTAGFLALAGVYQFSRLKTACLSRCRRPLTFFMAEWRPGLRGSFRAGVLLGRDCLGCCWALMGLAFVGGMASLVWMGLVMLLMAVEKLAWPGAALTRPLGWALLAASAVAATGGLG
ncbi:MAG: DUF2182 domain-containing protein [Gemmobacter sp.]